MPLHLPPLWLKQLAPLAPSEETAYVLDQSGALFGLHAGGRAPLCTYLSVHPPLATFKRYSFSHALRRGAAAAGPMQELLLADFDVVGAPGTAASGTAPAGSTRSS